MNVTCLAYNAVTEGGSTHRLLSTVRHFQTDSFCRFQFDIVDVWKDHTPQPFSSMPDTYSFLVKQPILWRLTYMSQQPRIIHKPYLWSCGNLIGRHINTLCAPCTLTCFSSPFSLRMPYWLKILDTAKYWHGTNRPRNYT